MNKFKLLALTAPLAIIVSLAFFNNAALANYTDEINGQIVQVTWAGYVNGQPTFNVTNLSTTPPQSLTGVVGTINPATGRGTPTLTTNNQNTLGVSGNVTPPTNYGLSQVTDSSENRTQTFCQTTSVQGVCGTNGLLQGYQVQAPTGTGTNLALDQTTTLAQAIVIAARAKGLSIASTTGANWSAAALAEAQSLGINTSNSGNTITAAQANAIFAAFGITGFQASSTNPNAPLTRAQLFNAITQLIGGAGGTGTGGGTGIGTGIGTGVGTGGGTGGGTPTPTPYCVFSANRTRILINQSSTLTWSCYNLDSCTMTPNPTTGTGTKTVAISGSASIQPQANTTYTLKCTGQFGSVSANATVDVYRTSIQESSPTSFLGNVKNWVANNLGLGVGTANAQ